MLSSPDHHTFFNLLDVTLEEHLTPYIARCVIYFFFDFEFTRTDKIPIFPDEINIR